MTKRERIAAYREAARKVAQWEEEFSCNAVRDSISEWAADDDPVVVDYAEMIRPRNTGMIRPSDFTGENVLPTDESQAHRVLALLLAAEMVRTGDL